MDILKDSVWLAVTVLGALGGGIAWLTRLHVDVTTNRKLREDDKKELLEHIETVSKRMSRLEAEGARISELFAEIKERLVAIETSLKLFVNKK